MPFSNYVPPRDSRATSLADRSASHSVKDHQFSNLAHAALASAFYEKVFPGGVVAQATVKDDRERGIDYYVDCSVTSGSGASVGRRFTIQERFRRSDSRMVRESREFTLRYARPDSISAQQKMSEFFKIEADYLYYGITNATGNAPPTQCLRHVLVDIPLLMDLVNTGKIIIDESPMTTKQGVHPRIAPPGVPVAGMYRNNEPGAPYNSWLVVFNVEHIIRCGLTHASGRALFPAHQGYLPQDSMGALPGIQPSALPPVTVPKIPRFRRR